MPLQYALLVSIGDEVDTGTAREIARLTGSLSAVP
jgi:hypothetical protein